MKSVLRIASLFLTLVTAAMAQVNTSTLAGLVKDESGSAIPNAKVTATMLGTGQQRSTTSNEAGEYVVPQLAPGGYRLSSCPDRQLPTISLVRRARS